MKPYIANLINAISLLVFGLWQYFATTTEPSFAVFLPPAVGFILILINWNVKKEDKVWAHIAVILTLFVYIGLINPLTKLTGVNDGLTIMREVIMMVTNTFALIIFVLSFINVRRNRKAEN